MNNDMLRKALDTGYFGRKLAIIARDLYQYTPQEMARELVRLAKVADESEALASSAAPEPLTYTVDGVRMSPLEYISHLHDLLKPVAAPSSGESADERAEWTRQELVDEIAKLESVVALTNRNTQMWKDRATAAHSSGVSADADKAPTRLDLLSLIRSQMHRSYTAGYEGGEIDPKYIAEIEDAVRAVAARPAPVGAVQARVHSLLESTARNLTGLDKNQLGYEYAKGWNAALRQIGDYVRGGALAPAAPAAPEVSNRTSAKIARVEVANRTTAKIAAVAPAAPTQQAAHHQGDIESNQALANDIGVFEHQQQATPEPGTNDAPAAPIASDITRPASDIAGVASDISEHAKPEPVEQAEGARFHAWWAREIANNGSVNIGADYRHWAKKGYQAGQQAGGVDGLAWESTTPAYTRFITQAKYDKMRPSFQKWYRPICQKCASANQKGE